MPLPKPNRNETKDQFISRCMSDAAMIRDYGDVEQRFTLCLQQWDSKGASLDSMPEDNMILALSDENDEWTKVGVVELDAVTKVPSQRFVKTIIRVGEFHKQAGDVSFSVTQDTMRHWVDTFNRMKENDVKVWIPADHASEKEVDREPLSDRNRGHVDHLFIEGDNLRMIATLVGEDALRAVPRNDVSIKTVARYEDCDKNEFLYPIRFVSMTPAPVITKLGGWVPIAASSENSEKEPIMPMHPKTRKLLGIKDDVKDDDLDVAIAKGIEARDKKIVKDAIETSAENPKPNGKPKPDEKPKPDSKRTLHPMELSAMTENREMKIDREVELGRIVPAEAKKLKATFASKDAIGLALSSEAGDSFDSVIEAIRERPKVDRSEQTNSQVLRLADEAKDEDEKPDPLVANQQAHADGVAKKKKTG